MEIEEGVIWRLLEIPAVVALISTRAYPLLLPQMPVLPAVRVQVVNEGQHYHLRGQTNAAGTLIQVDSYAERRSGADPFADASELARAIKGTWEPGASSSTPPDGLSGWRGRVGGSPPTLEIRGAFFVNRATIFEPNEFRLVRVRQDFRIQWRQV